MAKKPTYEELEQRVKELELVNTVSARERLLCIPGLHCLVGLFSS
jgi:hypothetical protein